MKIPKHLTSPWLTLVAITVAGCGGPKEAHTKTDEKSSNPGVTLQCSPETLPFKITESPLLELTAKQDAARLFDTGQLSLSPNLRKVAHAASVIEGRRTRIGVTGRSFHYCRSLFDLNTDGEKFLWSPDSKRLACVVELDGGQSVMVDGVPGPTYEGIGSDSLRFSSDGQKLAYAANRWNEDLWDVVVNGKVVDTADRVGPMQWMQEGTSLSYFLLRDGQWEHVVGDRRIKAQSLTPELSALSADGSRYVFAQAQDGKMVLNTNGKLSKPIRIISPLDVPEEPKLIMSPDGLRVACITLPQPKQVRLLLDGKVGERFESLAKITFSPDSKRVGYATFKGLDWRVVVDGLLSEPVDGVAHLEFSANSEHFAQLTTVRGNFVLTVDGVEHGPFDSVSREGFQFSGDSEHWIIVGKRAGGRVLVVDGTEIDIRGQCLGVYGTRKGFRVAILRGNTIVVKEIEPAGTL